MKKVLGLVFLLSSFVFASKVEVTASILPQKYFIEKIAKDRVEVNIMVKPGFSPATYEPKTKQMRMLSKSKIYFAIGVPFESVWLEKFESANKEMKIVDTSRGIEKLSMAKHSHHHEGEESDEHDKHDDHDDEEHHDNEHDEEHHEHEEHGGIKDPHIWLDPILVKDQAKNILDALVEVDRDNREFYRKNYEVFMKELEELNSKIEELLKGYNDSSFMVFHPSWGYFAKRYDLKQIAVELEGKEPKPSELIELIKEAKEESIKVVFVQPQFSQKSAKTIASILKAKVVKMNPLALNWDESLLKNAKAIADAQK